jgi:hypothetical protein
MQLGAQLSVASREHEREDWCFPRLRMRGQLETVCEQKPRGPDLVGLTEATSNAVVGVCAAAPHQSRDRAAPEPRKPSLVIGCSQETTV